MRKQFTKALLAVLCLAALSSCVKENPSNEVLHYTKISRSMSGAAETFVVPIYAGQHIHAGDIILSTDYVNVEVCYVTNSEWSLKETHLYIGDFSGIPRNKKGQPINGHFPISESFSGSDVHEACYSIPFTEEISCGTIAAHCVVQSNEGNGTETGWAEGSSFSDKNWSMYFNYCFESGSWD